jgi:hypothetical protein
MNDAFLPRARAFVVKAFGRFLELAEVRFVRLRADAS